MGSSQYEPRGMGADPPTGMEWQIGKTAITIRSVGALEEHLKTANVDAKTERKVRALIDDFKSGRKTVVTTAPDTISDEALLQDQLSLLAEDD